MGAIIPQGLLGSNFLSPFKVQIDFHAKTVTLTERCALPKLPLCSVP
jgi:hypothetical protein